jgi:hypothetical protein
MEFCNFLNKDVVFTACWWMGKVGGYLWAFVLYTNELKSCFLAASAWQQIFGLRSRLAIQQWSLAPDTKICAASLPKLQL